MLILGWKALQAALRQHGISEAENGSPREILKLGYKFGFVDDAQVWLLMMKMRNISVHVYDEEQIDELLLMIRDSFILAYESLEKTLISKIEI